MSFLLKTSNNWKCDKYMLPSFPRVANHALDSVIENMDVKIITLLYVSLFHGHVGSRQLFYHGGVQLESNCYFEHREHDDILFHSLVSYLSINLISVMHYFIFVFLT